MFYSLIYQICYHIDLLNDDDDASIIQSLFSNSFLVSKGEHAISRFSKCRKNVVEIFGPPLGLTLFL